MAQENIAPQSAQPIVQVSPIEVREANLKLYDRILASISAIGLIAGGIWGLVTYSESKKQESEHKASEIELRKYELDLSIFKERKEAYYALCDAACDIAASHDRNDVIERSREFLKLYNGRAHIIAEGDNDVFDKKIAFQKKLMSYLKGKNIADSPYDYFESAAYQLTMACRKHTDPRTLETYTLK
jgi:hypothetical protein